MKTVYREKRYYCGEYLDVYIYPTYRQGRSRGKRSKPTSAAQAKLNQRHREEKLVRLLHANFTPDDLEIHLTYQQQPERPEEAQRLLRNYIRRVQRARKKQGLPPLKYIAVTEKGSKNGRYSRRLFGGDGVVLPNAGRAQDRRFQNRVRPCSRRLLGRRNESERLRYVRRRTGAFYMVATYEGARRGARR